MISVSTGGVTRNNTPFLHQDTNVQHSATLVLNLGIREGGEEAPLEQDLQSKLLFPE